MSGKNLNEMLAEINAILDEDDEEVDPDGPVRGVETLQDIEFSDSTEEDAGDSDPPHSVVPAPHLIGGDNNFTLALGILTGAECREAFRREAMREERDEIERTNREIEMISRGELQRYWTAEYTRADGTPVPVRLRFGTIEEQSEE